MSLIIKYFVLLPSQTHAEQDCKFQPERLLEGALHIENAFANALFLTVGT